MRVFIVHAHHESESFNSSLTKEAMWTALEIPAMQSAIDLENRQQIMTSLTQDAAEAMNAFVEKRNPHFRNL